MATGWAGLSMVCYAESLQAARATCAGSFGCGTYVAGPTTETDGSDKYTYTSDAPAFTGTIHVQPCERLDGAFFGSLLPVVIPAAVAIILARRVHRMFDTHA